MISNFVFKLFLILSTVTANNFCTDLPERFGCHNLSSVDKITSIDSNNNELLRNLIQCMRDTNLYNKENLDIVQKLNCDFVKAYQETSYDLVKQLKDFGLVLGSFFIVPIFSWALSLVPRLPVESDAKSAIKIGLYGTLILYEVFLGDSLTEQKFDMRKATDNKWLTIIKIKDFADTLQKNKNLTQDIQAAPQNK